MQASASYVSMKAIFKCLPARITLWMRNEFGRVFINCVMKVFLSVSVALGCPCIGRSWNA